MLISVLIFSIWNVAYADNIENIIEYNIESPRILYQNKCIEDLGCFYTGPPFFHPLFRPISVTPTSKLLTKYLLFTPKNPKEPEEIVRTEKSIKNSSFDENLPVKLLVHGYNSNAKDTLYFKMKDAMLKQGDYNIIILDWAKNAKPPYHQAVANARVVGAQAGILMNFITEHTSVKSSNIHLIGHSLGAHLVGWAGERIPNLARITGLDPAGPYFVKGKSQVRLDSTDANFVDIILTDGKGLGLYEPIGHLNFYVNGGKNQPGCFLPYQGNSSETEDEYEDYEEDYDEDYDEDDGTEERQLLNLGCDHMRAVNYFNESIHNSQCQFRGSMCLNWQRFRRGKCLPSTTTKVVEMGFHATKVPGVPLESIFFLRTGKAAPFCLPKSEYPKILR